MVFFFSVEINSYVTVYTTVCCIVGVTDVKDVLTRPIIGAKWRVSYGMHAF